MKVLIIIPKFLLKKFIQLSPREIFILSARDARERYLYNLILSK